MKFQFIILCTLVLIIACKKDNLSDPNPYWGNASTEFNGGLKHFMPYCTKYDTTLDITLDCFECDSFIQFNLFFSHLQKREYRIDTLKNAEYSSTYHAESAELFAIEGGDVLVRTYHLLESENNFLEITYWDESSGEIKGKFQASFYSDTPNSNPQNHIGPDTVRIKNGDFFTRVYK